MVDHVHAGPFGSSVLEALHLHARKRSPREVVRAPITGVFSEPTAFGIPKRDQPQQERRKKQERATPEQVRPVDGVVQGKPEWAEAAVIDSFVRSDEACSAFPRCVEFVWLLHGFLAGIEERRRATVD